MTEDDVEWRTKFNANDVAPTERLDGTENKQEHYNRLAVANTLDWDGKWRNERRVTDKSESGAIDVVASSLELTDFQKEYAHSLRKQVPTDVANGYEDGILLVALCVCGMAARRDGRAYHPNHIAIHDTENLFTELVDELGFSYQTLWRVWARVNSEVNDA